ncbi:hypothetical protein [Pseudomonas sp. ML96]|uniref:hypothetical protein n=1 Tax=Pseudomonas sp. ML96 TaxID=1523503 RepID=UPI0012E09C16|nr:hypothetical protein [Pseudomonas sp. ML96]
MKILFVNLSLLTSLLLAATAAASTEHLAPVNITPEYYEKLTTTFRSGYSQEPSLQALVLPSLSNEFLTGVRATSEGQEAFLIEPKYSVHMFQVAEAAKEGNEMARQYVFPPDIPDSYLKNPTQIHSKNISDDLSHRLCKIWIHELYKTKATSRDKRILLDPTTFIFSANTAEKGQTKGQAVDPDRGSRVRAFSNLAYALRSYALGDMSEDELEKLTSAFETQHPKPTPLSAGECEKL